MLVWYEFKDYENVTLEQLTEDDDGPHVATIGNPYEESKMARFL